MHRVISERGRPKLVHENYIYVFSKCTADDVHGIWVCEKRSQCKGRVWTSGLDGPVVKTVTDHSHAAQAARPEALQIVQGIRERAIETHENPHMIVGNAIRQAHDNVKACLPKKDSLKRTIRRVRNNDDGHPALPQNLEELEIPQV